MYFPPIVQGMPDIQQTSDPLHESDFCYIIFSRSASTLSQTSLSSCVPNSCDMNAVFVVFWLDNEEIDYFLCEDTSRARGCKVGRRTLARRVRILLSKALCGIASISVAPCTVFHSPHNQLSVVDMYDRHKAIQQSVVRSSMQVRNM